MSTSTDIPSSPYRDRPDPTDPPDKNVFAGANETTPSKVNDAVDELHAKQQGRSKKMYRPMSSSSPSRGTANASRSLNGNKNCSPRASANTPRNKHQVESHRRAVQRESNAANSRSRLEDTRRYQMFREQMSAESHQLDVDVDVLLDEEQQAILEMEQFEIEQYELEMMLNDMTLNEDEEEDHDT